MSSSTGEKQDGVQQGGGKRRKTNEGGRKGGDGNEGNRERNRTPLCHSWCTMPGCNGWCDDKYGHTGNCTHRVMYGSMGHIHKWETPAHDLAPPEVAPETEDAASGSMA